jgi:AraC-like DNA-binding protein
LPVWWYLPTGLTPSTHHDPGATLIRAVALRRAARSSGCQNRAVVTRRSVPEVDAATLRDLFGRQGMTIKQVADVTGLRPRTLYRRLAEFGIGPRGGLRGPRYTQAAAVLTPAALHQWAVIDGLKPAEIAQRTGVDRTTVGRYLAAAGIVAPPKAAAPPRVDGRRGLRAHPEVDEAVLRDLYQQQGLSLAEGAARTGLTSTQFVRALRCPSRRRPRRG